MILSNKFTKKSTGFVFLLLLKAAIANNMQVVPYQDGNHTHLSI